MSERALRQQTRWVPCPELGQKTFGKMTTPLNSWPRGTTKMSKHPSHRWSDHATTRLEAPSTEACQKIPGQPHSVQRAPGRGQDPSSRQSWVGGQSSKVNLSNRLTDPPPPALFSSLQNLFRVSVKKEKSYTGDGFKNSMFQNSL